MTVVEVKVLDPGGMNLVFIHLSGVCAPPRRVFSWHSTPRGAYWML